MSSPKRAGRKEVLDALASAEGAFGRSLRALINAYYSPLNASRQFSPMELSALFRNLLDIREVHGKLGGVIHNASEANTVAPAVLAVANELSLAKAALLELYVPFARGHGEAMRTLRGASARTDVARLLSTCASDESAGGRGLEDLLTLPLLHAADLSSLLGSLASLSPPGDGAAGALADAAEVFTAVLREAAHVGYVLPSNRGGGGGSGSASEMVPSGVSSRPAATPGAAPSSSFDATSLSSLHLAAQSAASSAAAASSSSLLSVPPASPAPGTGSFAALMASLTGQQQQPGAAPPSTWPPQHGRGTGAATDGMDAVHLTTDAVMAAQNEADEAVRHLDELEREVALKESELKLANSEVARVEAEARSRGAGALSTSAGAAMGGTGPMDDALRTLQEEERAIYARMAGSEHRAVFDAFLQRKKELEDEEAKLASSLHEHEDTLAQIRARLANPPPSVLPADPAKAALYVAWKKALADREELLRQARRRKHELLRDLKARFETQVVLLEMERSSAVNGLRETVAAERAKVDEYRKKLSELDASIEDARGAMKRFRSEFEQLRVALLIDRMAKSTQVANLADRRTRLQREAAQFQEAVDAARAKAAADESAKWEARLAEEKAAGEKRIAEERKIIEQKIEKVRAALAERYEAGFRPLLRQAEQQHADEMAKLVALQRELESKEAELRDAHEMARAVSAAVTATGEGEGPQGGAASDGIVRDPSNGEPVPEWKLREFDDLKAAVAGLWEQLDVPAEDVTAFLSEADLMAPFSPQVLALYVDMYQRLSGALPPVPAAPIHLDGSQPLYSSAGGASGDASPLPRRMPASGTPNQATGGSAPSGGRGAKGALSMQEEYLLSRARQVPPSLGGPGSSQRSAQGALRR